MRERSEGKRERVRKGKTHTDREMVMTHESGIKEDR